MKTEISQSIQYIGVQDNEIDLFESQYSVPNGISYNSYVIIDEKICVMDTVDRRKSDEWLNNLLAQLGTRTPDYLVISHLEPDHSYNIGMLANKFPNMKLIGNIKTFNMLPQFFDIESLKDRFVEVKEGDCISLGEHTLSFYMAPMVHWPEVMVTYDNIDKVLFSADGFGKFGTLDCEENWDDEARRYYFNICGKYGAMVQKLLQKASKLDIKKICPLHGPVLSENLPHYLGLYDIWSRYEAQNDGILIAYASIHSNTEKAALKFAEILSKKTEVPVITMDLSRSDMSKAVENAFRYCKLVVAAPTYDGGIFPIMNDFLHHLKIKAYQNRKVGIIENGSWTPMSGKLMTEYFDSMKNIEICTDKVTIRSTMKQENLEQMKKLAEEIIE